MPHTLTFPPTTPETAQRRIDVKSAAVAGAVLEGRRNEKRPPKAAVFEKMSKGMAMTNAKRAEKFTVNDGCVGCGTCVSLCPRGNIKLESEKPVFGTDCIGCLSCIQFCPKQAINIGSITENRERFPNSKVKPAELTEKIIHID